MRIAKTVTMFTLTLASAVAFVGVIGDEVDLVSVGEARGVSALPAVECHECKSCLFFSCDHKVKTAENGPVGGPNHGCEDINCDPCPHPECNEGMSKDSLRTLRAVVEKGAAADLMPYFADKRVLLNVSRKSIQVEGCGGNVAANFPVSAATVAALTERERSLRVAAQ